MDELVNMLRGMALGPTNWPPETWQTYANMAADEIEHLRADRNAWMAHHLYYHKDCREKFWPPDSAGADNGSE